MVPFQEMVKNRQQKWYHFSEKTVIIPRQKSTISEEGKKSSTKMVQFQKKVKNRQQKRYHFRKWRKCQ